MQRTSTIIIESESSNSRQGLHQVHSRRRHSSELRAASSARAVQQLQRQQTRLTQELQRARSVLDQPTGHVAHRQKIAITRLTKLSAQLETLVSTHHNALQLQPIPKVQVPSVKPVCLVVM